MLQLHAVVYGRVQGVSFRYYAARKAQELGLTGWIRNRADGTVETIAVGSRAKLDEFLTWLHHGPPAAHVVDVDTIWADEKDAGESFQSFEVRHE